MELKSINIINSKLKNLSDDKFQDVLDFVNYLDQQDEEFEIRLRNHIDEILITEKKEDFIPYSEVKNLIKEKYGI